jgi:hypothetical protein
MGYKTSLVIVKQPSGNIRHEELLEKLGYPGFSFSTELTFDGCMYTSDKSFCIGHYNNCLIISDDYQLTDALDQNRDLGSLTGYEKVLTTLYPDSEVLSVACHSVVNYHVYSLVYKGQKIRYKRCVDGDDLREFGNRLEEEDNLYALSKMIGGQRMFRSPYTKDGEYEYTEDALMEDFTFGVAKRHLNVMISTGEDEELMNVLFRQYVKAKPAERKVEPVPKENIPARGSCFSRLFRKK